MIEDNEGLELELISFFRASTVSRLHSCVWSFLACLARFAQRTKKRETARSREQGIGGNAQPCKTGSYRSYPSWWEGGVAFISFIRKRKKRSRKNIDCPGFQILEFCQKVNWKMYSLHIWTIHSNTLLNWYTFWIELLNSMMREKTQLWLFFHPPFFSAEWKASGKRICHQRIQTEEIVQYSTVGKSKATLFRNNISFTHCVAVFAVFSVSRFFYEGRRENGPMGMWH